MTLHGTPSPASERRDRNRLEMRETILDAARRTLNTEGVSALSMRAVARDIRYSPASLYEYFPSKAALCQALFFEGASGLSGRIRSVLESSPADMPSGEMAAAMGVAYREYALENPELYLLVFSNPVPEFVPDEKDREHASGGFDLLVDAMRRGVESGHMREMDPSTAALAAWSLVHGFVMLEIVGYIDDGTHERNDDLFRDLLTHAGNWHRPASGEPRHSRSKPERRERR